MSSTSNTSSTSVAISLPPPGTNWLATIDVAVVFMMIGSTTGAVLVTMLASLLFFSTHAIRRSPIFILNVLIVFLGIVQAAFNLEDEIRTLKYPTIPIRPWVTILLGSFSGYLPIIVDCVLIMRLYAVYPPSTTPRLKFIVVMSMPILIKIARIVNATIYIEDEAHNSRTWMNTATAAGGSNGLTRSHLPYVKLQWFFEVFDDLFSSGLFLLRIWEQGNPFRDNHSLTQKIRTLFWIAVSNFVLPVILGVLQIAFYMADPQNYLISIYIEEVNLGVTVIGVVFATVWVAEGRWSATHDDGRGPTTTNIDSDGALRQMKEDVTGDMVFACRSGDDYSQSAVNFTSSSVSAEV